MMLTRACLCNAQTSVGHIRGRVLVAGQSFAAPAVVWRLPSERRLLRQSRLGRSGGREPGQTPGACQPRQRAQRGRVRLLVQRGLGQALQVVGVGMSYVTAAAVGRGRRQQRGRQGQAAECAASLPL